MNESQLRELMVSLGDALYRRGYSPGSSGNMSVKLDDGFLMTPTNSRMGMLEPEKISRLDADGQHIGGDPPSKEVIVHRAMYRARPEVGAVVHLHSPYCMAVSCLQDLDPENALPALTPYYIMRIGQLPVLPYFRPGDPALAYAVAAAAANAHALLLIQHGMIVGEKNLDAAVNAAEELEETCRLYLMLNGRNARELTSEQVADLHRKFPR